MGTPRGPLVIIHFGRSGLSLNHPATLGYPHFPSWKPPHWLRAMGSPRSHKKTTGGETFGGIPGAQNNDANGWRISILKYSFNLVKSLKNS